jgi:hypothetical protein
VGSDALGAAAGERAEPIRAHPDNPHYYLFRGQPTVLITSAEHYGAVINRAFDYNIYLDALKSGARRRSWAGSCRK